MSGAPPGTASTLAPPPSRHASWRPLLDGVAAERARETVLAIAEALRRPPAAGTGGAAPGLTQGHAGRALFFTYLAAALDEPAWREPAAAALDAAVAALAEQPVGPALFGGFAGVGWTVEHLAGRLFPAEEAAEATEEIDGVLASLLDGRWSGPYDLIDGLAGFVLYALEGLPRPAARRCLELAVEELGRRSEGRDGGRTWFTQPDLLPDHQRDETPHGSYNLGLAHGAAGVIVALARARGAGVGGSAAGSLLEEAVDWLLGNEQGERAPACFANWIAAGPDGTPEPAPQPQLTRLAWCYGDPGIAAALRVAARTTGYRAWGAAALRVARRAAVRPAERSGIRDAALCHGAGGVAHVFNRLAQDSGDATLADAARRAYLRTLDLGRPGEGVAGYLSWEPSRGGWTASTGFLTGAAGVGLALLAGLAPLEPEWDRVLGLSDVPVDGPDGGGGVIGGLARCVAVRPLSAGAMVGVSPTGAVPEAGDAKP